MISNLPLLFADGQPTCLDKISIGQLEKFVPFMVQCSCGQNDVRKLTAPPWWPSSLHFTIPLVRPREVSDSKWFLVLKSLVCRCYQYHECDFMLRFCAELSQLPVSDLKYVNSWDGTTSLYNKVNGKLLVTFRNENLFYDKKRSSPKKTLLSRTNGESGEQQAMVQPPLYDVYLCDNCDEEFNTLKEVQEHEKCCCTQQRDPSPPRVTEESSKDCFLNYFNLINIKGNNLTKNIEHPLRKRGFRNSFWYSTIPISSPLGMLVYKKTRASPSTALVQLERLERHCPAKPSNVNEDNRDRGSTLWPVSWKPRKKTEDDDWVHMYRKPGRQWRERTKTSVKRRLENKKQNLLSQCQNLQVYVRKLTPSEIAYYTNNSNDAKRASISSVVESKCNRPLVSRQSTNSVHLPSPKATVKNSSVIKNYHSRKQKIDILTSVNKQNTTNGKRVNSCLGNGDTMNRRQTKSELEVNVSPKVANSFSPSVSKVPHILSGPKTSPEVSHSKADSKNLSLIPIIDLVSSDEECEII